ncbi:MAG TPA: chemotaxis protein CheW, partial [Pirellulaceae bacterium]|nr:chemotaxis protein CheW [Pirellulaceae bacterium]
GTNELEILVFRLGDYTFGINVAKVREVLPRGPITRLPKAHDSVLGVFSLRDVVVPVVSLRRHLQVREGAMESDQTLILADFNQQQTAFVVDAVERIHRMSWEHILSVPSLSSLANSPITAVARLGERLVIMLDFEMITDQVTEQFYRTGTVANPLNLPRGELQILLADDSPTVREAVGVTLRSSGYTNLRFFENGREAWDWLEAAVAANKPLAEIADLLISDVEMPQIDGLHLTKRIKEHRVLGRLPVLLYSSIVTPDNHKKGVAVGADAQISKPELAKVVELADRLIIKASQATTLDRWIAPPAPALSTQLQQLTADLSPAWEVEEEPSPPATENNPRVWQTFRAELADRARHLRKLLNNATTAQDESFRRELLRTLHTIKSAAMVVPVHEVTKVTHALESLLDTAHQTPSDWPLEAVQNYTQWLSTLAAAAPREVPGYLALGATLQAEFRPAATV